MDVIKAGPIENRFEKRPEYFSSERADLLALIPKDSRRILDVGCGAGERWIGFQGEVSGIEINEEAAAQAKKHLKIVVTGDTEKTPLPFEKNYFDCIVFADVLEHLYDPWGMLLKFRDYLKPGGSVLISIPNIRHYRVLRALIFGGEFSYEDSGILDIDHVRFFTRKELEAMLSKTGFEIQTLQRKISASSKYRVMNALLFNSLSDFLAEQFYILAKRP